MPQSPSTNLPILTAASSVNISNQPLHTDNETFSIFPRRSKSPSIEPILPPRRNRSCHPNQLAKREILANVRTDWTWPPSSSPADVPPTSRLTATTQYRARDSDSDSPPSPSPPSSNFSLVKSMINPYKYENPDSLGLSIQVRRRKRHRRLRKEMDWNDGLATFIQRRNAWAGARAFPQNLDTDPVPLEKGLVNGTAPVTATMPLSSPSSPSSSRSSSRSSSPTTPLESAPMVPLPPPLLSPTHPARVAVTPSAYPLIYSRVVTQGVSPGVPINLSDMVQALVQGWKENGDWPPKGSLEADAGAVKGGLGADGNGKKGLLGGDKVGKGMGTADEKNINAEGRLLGKSMRTGLAKRGVGRMKKVLGLGTEEKEKTDGGDLDPNVGTPEL
ncbi:hypothetical protein MMC07_003345 [Pseudocyphellaria aurata]|nr:hypothetical protein [Pseudocyphellaria aurata]